MIVRKIGNCSGGALSGVSSVGKNNDSFGLSLSTIFSEFCDEFNSHYKDAHDQLSQDIPYIKHRVKFALMAGARPDRGARSLVVDDITSRYVEMLSPIVTIDVLESLLQVGEFIANHPKRDKSQHILERYLFAEAALERAAAKRGFSEVYIR